MPEQKHRSRSLVSVFFLLVVLVGLVAVLFNRQLVVDTYIAARYQPSADMSDIRDSLDLTSEGARLFNASQPIIEDASTFNKNCNQQSETNNPILGCYAAQRIYVYEVTNTELNGIEETTAAHELLHAAYERMSASDKTTIDAALWNAYEKVKTPELEARMDYYKKSEPGQEANELHSILGTEQPALSSTLEDHYAKYFNSRQKIVNFFKQYNDVFTSATNRLKSLQSQINSQVAAVNQRIERYNTSANQLQVDTTDFNQRSDNGDFSSQQDFLNQRAQLVARQDELNREKAGIEQQINSSNLLRDEYNRLVEKYNQLNTSINSSLSPAPSL